MELKTYDDEQAAREESVDAEYCVWCKGSLNPGSSDVVGLSTGESLCQACLGDMREWIRWQQIRLFTNPKLASTPERIIHDYWQEMQYHLTTYYENVDDLFPEPTVRHDSSHIKDYYEPPQG